MISKERLQKLIDEKATIWADNYGEIQLCDKSEVCDTIAFTGNHQVQEGYCLCGFIYSSKFISDNIEPTELEENVEKGAWDYEMHATRIERFEPPYKLNIGECYEFTSKEGCRMGILNWNNEQYWVQYVGTHTRFNTYKEAAEYVRKMFLGEK